MIEQLAKRAQKRARRRQPARVHRSLLYVPSEQALYWAEPTSNGRPNLHPLNGAAAQRLNLSVPTNVPTSVRRAGYLLMLDNWQSWLS